MMWRLPFQRLALVVLTACAPVGESQTPSTHSSVQNPPDAPVIIPAPQQQLLQDAKQSSTPLVATATGATVGDSLSVEAVLLPKKICKKVFGREIASNYAVVEITISNRNADAAFIVHSVFLDYTNWLLSGSPAALRSSGVSGDTQSGPSGTQNNPSPYQNPTKAPTNSWQSSGVSNQVSSVEARIARGDLLDAQAWTWRNAVIRGLEGVGAAAAAYQFAFKEQGIIRGIAAYNGQFVPAAQVFWPDDTVGQLNRISDFGFRTNQVVAKQSSEITVAFFPIERFLTPGLKKAFLNSPALFYVPASLLADDKLDKSGKVFFCRLLSQIKKKDGKYGPAIATPGTEAKDNSNSCSDINTDGLLRLVQNIDDPVAIARVLSGISLNMIHVAVGGAMTVDLESIPATIKAVNFDNDASTATFWTQTGTDKAGTVQGSFLEGGVISVQEADKFGITIGAGPGTPTSEALPFTMQFTKAIPAETHLHFQVTKQNKAKQTLDSTPFDYIVK